jgi:hypothetical protein
MSSLTPIFILKNLGEMKRMEKYKIDNRKLTQFLEEINVNVVRLNEQIENFIDNNGKKTDLTKKLRPGRFCPLIITPNKISNDRKSPKIS